MKATKIICRTPTPGKQPTAIDEWKFEAVRRAILEVVPTDSVGVPFANLPGLVKNRLSKTELSALGSVGWYTTTVKLELEVRGEIKRITGQSPQHLRRT